MAKYNARLNGTFCELGGIDASLSDDQIKGSIQEFLNAFQQQSGEKVIENVLILPPDYTRFHSQAGKITQFISEFYRGMDEGETSEDVKISILPALGTHAPMTDEQIKSMFGEKLLKDENTEFIVHNWRNDIVTIGEVPASMVRDATNGMVNVPWPAQLNRLVWEGGHDLVLSIGQVVPHEVMGKLNM